VSSHQLNSKTNGLCLLRLFEGTETVSYRLSPVASDGKDGNGLKFEKKLPFLSKFDATSSKNPQEIYYG